MTAPQTSAELYDGFNRFALSLSNDEPDADDPVGAFDQWLLVGVDIRSGTRVWSEEDTCLTRAEAAKLAEWMEQAAHGSDPMPPCAFHESNLRFSVDRSTPAGRIDVECDLEFAPPEWSSETPFQLSFPVQTDQLERFASSIREQLAEIDAPHPAQQSDPLQMLPAFRRRP